MQRLSKQLLSPAERMEDLPERIIQFGEGNFLRGFVDWMIHEMNRQGVFNGRVVAVQPTPHGKVVPQLNAQDGLYTLALRGVAEGKVTDKTQIISSISRGINPYEDWGGILKLAENKEIQFVFSNTTEAGLTYKKEAFQPAKSPLSFPGKVTAFLYRRYTFFGGSSDSGMTLIPCELVENNGSLLKGLVLKIARDWELPEPFFFWLEKYNIFCNTLVDRIVTGYPKDQIETFRGRLGYEDTLLTVGEPYHLFAIDAGDETAASIPFHQAGLNVHWGDVEPFRELKVKILNGTHTMMFAVAYLSGKDTVLEAMDDGLLRQYINKGIYQEILPVLEMKEMEKKKFADAVVERFLNPFNKHYLTNLGLSAVHKYKDRVLPTLLDWAEGERRLPDLLTFSLAALIAYYHPREVEEGQMIGKRDEEEYVIRDQPEVMQLFKESWEIYDGTEQGIEILVHNLMEKKDFWVTDLTRVDGLPEKVGNYLFNILNRGVKRAVDELL